MRSTTLVLVAACLSLAAADCNQQAVITSCSNDVAAQTCPPVANGVVDRCGCSKVSRILSCYTANCPGEPQVSSVAAAEYSAICLGVKSFSGTTGSGATSTSASSVLPLPTSTAAVAGTGTNTLATGTATGTGDGSAAPASTSKAGGQKNLALPAGDVIVAVLVLAMLL